LKVIFQFFVLILLKTIILAPLNGATKRPTSISLLLTYDLTNWSPGGWAHYLEGFTIYLSNSNESAFSPVNGILLSDIAGGVPIVSMKEKRIVRRGGPYSTCYNPDKREVLGSNLKIPEKIV